MMARLLALFITASTASIVAQQTTFRSTVDAVVVDVAVRDGKRVVTGLGPSDFALKDNGVAQVVTDVSYGALPIDITIALDVSGSVNGTQLNSLRRAVTQLMMDLGPADRVRLMLFNESVRRAVDFTSKPEDIDLALQRAIGRGATSVVDALSLALVSAVHLDRRQLVMIFTDGADTTSTTSTAELKDLVRHTDATISAVVPIGRTAAVGQAEYLKVWSALATETGGVVTRQEPQQNLTETFRKTLDEFRSSYVLRFSPNGVPAGGFHTLEVSVPGQPKATVRARRGYWAGSGAPSR